MRPYVYAPPGFSIPPDRTGEFLKGIEIFVPSYLISMCNNCDLETKRCKFEVVPSFEKNITTARSWLVKLKRISQKLKAKLIFPLWNFIVNFLKLILLYQKMF